MREPKGRSPFEAMLLPVGLHVRGKRAILRSGSSMTVEDGKAEDNKRIAASLPRAELVRGNRHNRGDPFIPGFHQGEDKHQE